MNITVKTSLINKVLRKTAVLFLTACLTAAAMGPAAASADGSNSDRIYEYLTGSVGLNSAAACGVMGNIYQECTMNPDASGGSFYGICQWGGSRLSELYSYCSSAGYEASSLEGQLRYLEYELENVYTYTLSLLQSVPDTAEGAYDAAVYFCSNFEQPGNIDWENATRGSYARDMFWPSYGV